MLKQYGKLIGRVQNNQLSFQLQPRNHTLMNLFKRDR